jgi:hypothetical protein
MNNINIPISNANFHINSSSSNIFINNNFYTKIQKKLYCKKQKKIITKNKIIKLNKNLNKPNNNKYNSNSRLIDIDLRKKYENNNSNDKILLNNTDIKMSNIRNNKKK